MPMKKITEQDSLYDHLETMETTELIANINREDAKVAEVVRKKIPEISAFIDSVVKRMEVGGRLFYIGAGTSGRLGILDASECPPTFGVPHDWVIGIIAGGDRAIRKAVERAEDDYEGAWRDLSQFNISPIDCLVGIAASGTTPYVMGGLEKAQMEGVLTACITSNLGSPVTRFSDHPIEVVTGPEFVTGSTRMKAGTAQKMVLNMISTAVMVRLGRVLGNKMVDMQLSNNKLRERAIRMVVELVNVDPDRAANLLIEHGSVRSVLQKVKSID